MTAAVGCPCLTLSFSRLAPFTCPVPPLVQPLHETAHTPSLLLLPRTFHGALSGRENTQFLARIYGAAMRPTLDYVADFAELGDYFDMPVDTYSAGMRARLAFAACLAIDFDVYLIDEATEVGDQRFRRKCAEAFRARLARSDIILASHNADTLRQYCDRGALLAGGALTLFDDLGAAIGGYHRLLRGRA
jgi:capsular polysaccharide transport system ATP-binding protein